MSYLALAKQAQALRRAKAGRLGPAIQLETPEGTALLVGLLGMPLGDFGRQGATIGVRVPWYDELFWFVPAEAEAGLLEREGVHRGRIWTAAELLGLLSIPGLTPEQGLTVAHAKLAFTGEVVLVTDPPQRPGIPATAAELANAQDPRKGGV